MLSRGRIGSCCEDRVISGCMRFSHTKDIDPGAEPFVEPTVFCKCG